MEAALLWKAAMRPRLPTGLGKHRHEPVGVSHSSHSPCYWEKRARGRDEAKPRSVFTTITISKGGIFNWPTGGKIGWPLTLVQARWPEEILHELRMTICLRERALYRIEIRLPSHHADVTDRARQLLDVRKKCPVALHGALVHLQHRAHRRREGHL